MVRTAGEGLRSSRSGGSSSPPQLRAAPAQHARLHLLLALLLAALLLPSAAQGACTTDAECSGGEERGSCLPTGACRCALGWLGADCSIGSTAAQPVHVARFDGLLGQKIVQEWRVYQNTSAVDPRVNASWMHVRWTVNVDSWWGVIIEPGVDGHRQRRAEVL